MTLSDVNVPGHHHVMRVLVVFESTFGNTDQVARSVVTGLARQEIGAATADAGHRSRDAGGTKVIRS